MCSDILKRDRLPSNFCNRFLCIKEWPNLGGGSIKLTIKISFFFRISLIRREYQHSTTTEGFMKPYKNSPYIRNALTSKGRCDPTLRLRFTRVDWGVGTKKTIFMNTYNLRNECTHTHALACTAFLYMWILFHFI